MRTPSAQEQALPHIEVWNDLVSLRDLVTCLAVAAAGVVAAVVAARYLGGQLLFWGLGASVLCFLVNCRLIAPKREVRVVDDEEAGDEPADRTASAQPSDQSEQPEPPADRTGEASDQETDR